MIHWNGRLLVEICYVEAFLSFVVCFFLFLSVLVASHCLFCGKL